jgi:glycogen operon protein
VKAGEHATAAPISVWRGKPRPLGACWDGAGVNFALYSENAEAVELCLFDPKGRREIARIDIRERTNFVWHCYLPEARPGQLYGYRVHGPYAPERGDRFNPHKLLLDPYARLVAGPLRWTDAHYGYRVGSRREDLSFDTRDSATAMPKCRVIDSSFTWGNDIRPQTPWEHTVIYELHVKGFTQLHPAIRPQLRGTYAGLSTAPVIAHLQRLGVTAVELMPVHQFVDDQALVQRGLRNYWGYNSIGFFAPDTRYAAGDAVNEFKTMVKTLHAAGIEVLLDVVYNHTAEGNHLGPTLSFRGIDNHVYYRLDAENPRHYVDYTGTGNTLNTVHPATLQLVMDSLRYWVTEMHVDGFRFDLAATLGRTDRLVDQQSGFFHCVRQDPDLAHVKLIAEPWDLGEDGYQVGNFPPGWSEWTGKYRDAVRSYWKGDGGVIGELASRLSGSSDLFQASGRGPTSSINFVTAHDGFTLHDLVSYNEKHNEANGENGRDGENDNRSWNCGVEGPTDDPAIRALREQQKRNLLTTLLLSQGVPMILGGDEMGRTQQGNNNAYCQDSELSWVDWKLGPDAQNLIDFTHRLVALRNGHPLFRRRTFFHGRSIVATDAKDISWLNPDGQEITGDDWHKAFARCLGVFLSGHGLAESDAHGDPLDDDDLLLLLNAHHEAIPFVLPKPRLTHWVLLLDTAIAAETPSLEPLPFGAPYPLQGRSMAVLCSTPGDDETPA